LETPAPKKYHTVVGTASTLSPVTHNTMTNHCALAPDPIPSGKVVPDPLDLPLDDMADSFSSDISSGEETDPPGEDSSPEWNIGVRDQQQKDWKAQEIETVCPAPTMPEECDLYEQWDSHFLKYQDETSQNFSVNRSDAVKKNKSSSKSLPVEKEYPLSYKYRYIHYLCIHGIKPRKKRAKKKKIADESKEEKDAENNVKPADQLKKKKEVKEVKTRNRNSRFTGCQAEVTIHVPFNKSIGKYNGFKILSFKGKHNHPVHPALYRTYPRQRNIRKNQTASEDPVLPILAENNVSNRLLKNYIREKHDIDVTLKDVANLKSEFKKDALGSSSIESRVETFLETLPQGSTSFVTFNNELQIQSICFQTPEMKRLFQFYSDCLLLDTTYLVCAQGFALMTLMVTDGMGHGRPVYHALMTSETKECISAVLQKFAEHNDVTKTKVVVIDKDFTEEAAINAVFKSARIRICFFHAVKYLSKECCDEKYKINLETRKKLKALFSLLGNSQNYREYSMYFEKLRELSSSSFFQYYCKNWHSILEKWVTYACCANGIGNSTTNRLESFHDKLKHLVGRNTPVDELLKYIIMINNCVTSEQLQKISNTFVSSSIEDDPQMKAFMTYTTFIRNLLREQLKLSRSEQAYEIRENGVISIKSGSLHLATLSDCSCNHWLSYNLPCRHMFYISQVKNASLNCSIVTRWTVKNFLDCENFLQQISNFDVASADSSNAKVEIEFCDERVKKKALSSIEKYAQLKPIFESIARICTGVGTKDFASKKGQLMELVNSWNTGKFENDPSQSSSPKKQSPSQSSTNVIQDEKVKKQLPPQSSSHKNFIQEKNVSGIRLSSNNPLKRKITSLKDLSMPKETKRIGRPRITSTQVRYARKLDIVDLKKELSNCSNEDSLPFNVSLVAQNMRSAMKEIDKLELIQNCNWNLPDPVVVEKFSVRVASERNMKFPLSSSVLLDIRSIKAMIEKVVRKSKDHVVCFEYHEKQVYLSYNDLIDLRYVVECNMCFASVKESFDWLNSSVFIRPDFFSDNDSSFLPCIDSNEPVLSFLRYFSSHEVVYEASEHVVVEEKDMLPLFCSRLVGDVNVNAVFLKIFERFPFVYCGHTFFLQSFAESEHQYDIRKGFSATRMKRITKNFKTSQKVKDMKLLVFPINLRNAHWILVLADVTSKQATLYDPLGSVYKDDHEAAITILSQFLQNVFEFKWSFVVRYDPQQTDSVSCGVYICTFAEVYLKSFLSGRLVEEQWNHIHVPYLRRRLINFFLKLREDQLEFKKQISCARK
jgi:hypothetical protein